MMLLRRKLSFLALSLFFTCLRGDNPAEAAPVKVRVGLITPEGTTFTDFMKASLSEIEQAIQGRHHFVVYSSGVLGSETDMLRMLGQGELDVAGFSDVPMGLVCPETRLPNLPLFVRDHLEGAYLMQHLLDYYRTTIGAKGFVLLGWAPAGSAYVFSKKPVGSLAQINGQRIWLWPGDTQMQTILGELPGVQAVSLPIQDVRDALQQNRIDAFVVPPLLAVGLRWYLEVHHAMDLPLALTGAWVLASAGTWNRFDPADQQTVLRIATERFALLRDRAVGENKVALWGLRKHQIQFDSVTEADRQEILELTEKIRTKLRARFYPEALLRTADQALARYRAEHPDPHARKRPAE